jgi:hypothetical protein
MSELTQREGSEMRLSGDNEHAFEQCRTNKEPKRDVDNLNEWLFDIKVDSNRKWDALRKYFNQDEEFAFVETIARCLRFKPKDRLTLEELKERVDKEAARYNPDKSLDEKDIKLIRSKKRKALKDPDLGEEIGKIYKHSRTEEIVEAKAAARRKMSIEGT